MKSKRLRRAQCDKRRLIKDNDALRKALAQACDLALDAVDVIADENICDPEEDKEFRMQITELRELSKLPEAERHVERREVKMREKAERRRARQEQKARAADVALLQAQKEHASTKPC
jgi:hypothetical protein